MTNYEVTIGIEIHLELKTKTKMFSHSPNDFGANPNTLINPIDLGYPGTLPQPNEQAVIYAIKLAKTLNMKIDSLLRFDRKHYFYPDLPKGYQITQQFHPIGKNGEIEINVNNSKRIIDIERIHLEEDTATQIHKDDKSYLNFNRAGVPLIEIVTKPCIKNALEAAEYIKKMRLICFDLKISDAKMEEGSLRTDVNISLSKPNAKHLGNKVEIKNLNSVNNLIKAINYEIKLQTQTLDNNEIVHFATKKFDEAKQATVLLRDKTTVNDYRYLPEPNIAPIPLKKKFINDIKISSQSLEARIGYVDALVDRALNNPLEFDTLVFMYQFLKPTILFNNLQKSPYPKLLSEFNRINKNLDNTYIVNNRDPLIEEEISFLKNAPSFKANEDTLLKTIDLVLVELGLDKMKVEYQKNPEKIERLIMGKTAQKLVNKFDPLRIINLVKKRLSYEN